MSRIEEVSLIGTVDSLEYPIQYAGPRILYEDNHQAAAVMQDRIHIPGRIQLLAGGRLDSVRDHNYPAQLSREIRICTE